MPNRIIKESICTSENLACLNWFEQVLFVRLIVLADDFGIFDARPKVIKGRAFPLDQVSEQQISEALGKLAESDLIYCYEAEGRPYLLFKSWPKHQRIRAKTGKFPHPGDPVGGGLLTSDVNCCQLTAIDSNCPPNTIQSNPESNFKSNPESKEKETRTRYGRYENVYLSPEQYEKLKTEFPEDYDKRIEAVSEYCASSGKTYRNYFATICAWARRERPKEGGVSSFDTDKFFEAALNGGRKRLEEFLKEENDQAQNEKKEGE